MSGHVTSNHLPSHLRRGPGGVFLTGANGTLGRELLKALHAEKTSSIFLLLRSKEGKSSRARFDQLLTAQGVPPEPEGPARLIEGDVTEPCCGVLPADMALLRGSVDTIFHVAAATHLNGSRDLCERVNLDGTVEALRLARLLHRDGRLQRFVHFSTAFAPGSRHHYHSLEDTLPTKPCHANFYEWSKYRAEHRVRQEMAEGLPAIILRPSIVAGDSHTGAIGEFKVLYPIIRMFTLGLARVLPASLGGVLHLVPIDFVVSAALAIARRDDAIGRTCHLVSKAPPTVGMLIDAAVTLHPHLTALRVVAPDVLTREELPSAERSRLDALKPLLGYLDYDLTFDTRNTDTLLHGSGVAFPTTDRRYLTRLLEYAGSQGYLRLGQALSVGPA